MRECTEFQQQLADYIEKRLSPDQEREIIEHLKDCPSCQHELKESEVAWAVLQKEQDRELSPAFWANFAAEIRERIEKKKSRGLAFKPAWVLAPAAAALVIFAAISLFEIDKQFLSQKASQPEGSLVWLETQPNQNLFAQELEQSLDNLTQEAQEIYWEDEDLTTLLAELNEEQFKILEEKVRNLKF